jgi:hypothetical protein
MGVKWRVHTASNSLCETIGKIMALNIAYFGDSDTITGQCYGILSASVAYTVTGSSASVGTPPSNAAIARLAAGENCYVSNNGAAASATNGIYLAVGQVTDIEVKSGTALQAITG